MLPTNYKKIFILLGLLSGTLLFGTLSYYYIENINLFDSFYMTIITMSTVGFSEVQELSRAGRIITILIISCGISIGAYTIGSILRILIEGELAKTLGRRKLHKKIATLKNHYIICGYGRIGSLIAKDLEANNKLFVIIDNSKEAAEQLEIDKYIYLNMDATTEEALLEANIDKARGIVTAVQSDADNVYITLTARSLNHDIFILSRASDQSVEQKLKRAGASKVILPYLIGGRRMAQALIRPTVVDFIDIALVDSELGLVMEEARISNGSRIIGNNLIESNLRRDYGIIIVAIKKFNGKMIFNPLPHEVLDKDDVLVVIGEKKNLNRLSKIL